MWTSSICNIDMSTCDLCLVLCAVYVYVLIYVLGLEAPRRRRTVRPCRYAASDEGLEAPQAAEQGGGGGGPS
jgi:hypothetical protein